MLPTDPRALHKYMSEKGLLEVDQFPYRDWLPETKQMERDWKNYRDKIVTEKPNNAFNFRLNLIDKLRPFVNKRGVRDRNFVGDHHEVRLLQLDKMPGYAKLVYRNHDLSVGEMVPVYVQSRESIEADVNSVAKKLYKKAKKVLY